MNREAFLSAKDDMQEKTSSARAGSVVENLFERTISRVSGKVAMADTRRNFLRNLTGLSASFVFLQSSPPIPTPRRRTPVDPPTGANKDDDANSPDGRRDTQRAKLRDQEKDFRQTIDRLYVRVRDLKTEVDAIHSSEVFSVPIFKQTQEIEKLAKQLKNYAKT